MNLTLTGATGFIGRPLVASLLAGGHALTILSRRPRQGEDPRYIACDLSVEEPPLPALASADAVIHLSGEPIGRRWTLDVKRRIRTSRVDATRRLVEAIAKLDRRPSVLVSASAVGIYGDRGDEVLTEDSPPGSGFLEELVIDWERAADAAAALGLRVVKLRMGVVLGPGGGALAQMLPVFKAGLGGRLGSGRQWMPWIHLDDVVGLIAFAIFDSRIEGAVNAVAPHPVRNAEFASELARAVRRPALIPTPVFALRILFGEVAIALVASARVEPVAAIRAGYRFRFPELRDALASVVGRK